MILKWTFGLVFVMTLQFMESHGAREDSAVYEDWFFRENVKINNGNLEFAHIAARWTSFIGVGGTAQRIPLSHIELDGGGSQFQDKRGSSKEGTHAAHQVQAHIDIGKYKNHPNFEEIKNRLGHTDVIPLDLNLRFGTVIDEIQKEVLDAKLLSRIRFRDGFTRDNEIAARVIQRKFIDGVLRELGKRDGPVENGDTVDHVQDRVLLRGLLVVANETYHREKLFNEGLKAGIINSYNELTCENVVEDGEEKCVENTLSTVPKEVMLPPDLMENEYLSSKKILGTRKASKKV